MTEFQVPPPSHGEAAVLADWAESVMLIEGRSFLSRADLRDRLRDALFLDDPDELDEQMDLLFAEVMRRSETAPSFYPFQREELLKGVARQQGIESSPYEFLLWLSISPAFRGQRRQQETEGKFNGLVKQALSAYLGPGAKVVETAAASQGAQGTFRQVLEELATSMNLRYGTWEEPRTARKDGGVDLVAWRPFSDNRPGFIVLLCQCTVQIEWISKANDISTKLWGVWITFVRDPLTALAVPFAVPDGFDKWTEVRSRCDVIFDRFRLSELLEAENCTGIEELRSWCNDERALLYT